MTRVRIATRASELAVTQSELVAAALRKALGCETELVTMRTAGDRILDRPLAEIGGKGLFIKEVEEALLDGRADLAVHSAKDLPAALDPRLVLAAFPERADPRDAFVAKDCPTLDALPRGARIGTGSVRRTSQLRAWRPDLEVVGLRGNVGTRLRKMEESLDAVILATSGLDRLGLAGRIRERVPPERLLPAVGQGTLALQVCADDPLAERLAAVDHGPTRRATEAERAFLTALEGDCGVPLAALAEPDGSGRLRLRGLVASLDGTRVVRAEAEDAAERAAALGRRVAEEVRARGGEEILRAHRARTGR